MKQLLMIFSLFAMLATVAFAAPNSVVTEAAVVPVEISVETPVEDEGIGCKVRNSEGTVIAGCFICNCAKLADKALSATSD